METITQEQLKDLLYRVGNTVPFIGMDVETQPKVRKNAQGVIKRAKVTARAGARIGEPLSPRKWGERVKETPLVAHKGQIYLEVDVTHVKDEEYWCMEMNVPISKEDAVERGVRDRPLAEGINLRDYKLVNIKRIRMNKDEYEVISTNSSK